jgi:hypothetical protein
MCVYHFLKLNLPSMKSRSAESRYTDGPLTKCPLAPEPSNKMVGR